MARNNWDQPVSKEELAKAKSRSLDTHSKRVEDEDDREESGKSEDEDVEAAGPSARKHKGDGDEEFAPSEPEGRIMALPREERACVLGSISAPSASTSESKSKKPVVDAPIAGPSRQTTSTKRGRSQSPVVSKKRWRMIVSEDKGAEEGDDEDDEEEDNVQTLKQEDKKIVTDAMREEFKTVAALKILTADVRASLPRVDGELQYWEDERQVRVLTPNWEAGFPANWEVWGCVLMEGFRDRSRNLQEGNLEHGEDGGAERVKRDTGGRPAQAECEVAREYSAKQGQLSVYTRAYKQLTEMQLIESRAKARKGTSVADSAFDFLFAAGAQSPQPSDGETRGRMVRLEPPWLAQEAIDIKTALDQKAKLAEARDQPVVYFQADLPIQKASKTLVHPAWAMRAKWIDENKVLVTDDFIQAQDSSDAVFSLLYCEYVPLEPSWLYLLRLFNDHLQIVAGKHFDAIYVSECGVTEIGGWGGGVVEYKSTRR
ncbi:hypothetical protein FRC08_006950 [Ceratobasidium sp. 394]|nr:hypothetical protein FRC08_006950 [Ceratobasidium sp. 394]